MDPQYEVKKIVGQTVEIAPEYGGYEIKVVKPDLFPWHAVLNQTRSPRLNCDSGPCHPPPLRSVSLMAFVNHGSRFYRKSARPNRGS